MSDSVTIVFAAHWQDHVPGDEAKVPRDLAKKLVRAGKANYATEPADKATAKKSATTG